MKEGVLVSVLGWFANHLVAIGFIGFAAVAVVFRQPLFGPGEINAVHSTSEDVQVSEAVPTQEQVPEPEQEQVETETRDDQATPDLAAVDVPPKVLSGDASHPVFRPMDAAEQGVTPKDATDSPAPDAAKPVFRDPDRQPVNPSESPRARFEALFQQARKAVEADKPKQAESLFLRCLRLDPGDPLPFAELGDLYRSAGRTQEALDAYYEAGVRFERLGAGRQLAQIRAILAKAGDPRIRKLSVPRPE